MSQKKEISMIKCDQCHKGIMSIMYSREGKQEYVCSQCDHKLTKYEAEQKNLISLNETIELKKTLDELVIGYNDIKSMVIDIIDLHLKGLLDKPSHLLMIGTAGTCKTFLFECIGKVLQKSIFEIVDSSHLSGTGLISYLAEGNKYQSLLFLVLDELDKMEKKEQIKLLSGLESGVLKERKFRRFTELNIGNLLFFATANDASKIYEPLKTRFTILKLKDYTYQEYRSITDSWIKRKCPDNYTNIINVLFPNNDPATRYHIRTIKRVVDLSQCNPLKLDQYLDVLEKYAK